jgi:hypothetical protein
MSGLECQYRRFPDDSFQTVRLVRRLEAFLAGSAGDYISQPLFRMGLVAANMTPWRWFQKASLESAKAEV